jgi:hypothetical protein
MYIKKIESYRNVIALCDKKLIGKYFEEDKFQLEVKENFFKGEEINSEKAIKLIQDIQREDATFNIVGEKAIKTALDAGIISKDKIKKIQGIPYSLVLL